MEKKIFWKIPLAPSTILAVLTLCGSQAHREASGSCRCVPDQWEGVLSSVEREFDMNDGKTDTMENSIRVHYDYNNRRCSMTDLSTGKKALADYRLVGFQSLHYVSLK